MKKLIILIILGFGVYLLWGNVKTKQEDGDYKVSVDKDGVKQKLESTGSKLSGEAKSLEGKFNK